MSRAIVPVVFYWDDGTDLCESWDDVVSRDDGHNETLDHSPPRGSLPANRWWLSERRLRFMHEAQVRG